MTKAITLVVASMMMTTSFGALAQVSSGACSVDIFSPPTNARVGETGDVSGSAALPAGAKLWVFAHRKGLGLWWPQGGGPAQIVDGKWDVLTYYGVSRDIGSAFEVTARVVEPKQNDRLEEWVKKSQETNQYPGISMPLSMSGCLVKTITVTRDH